MDPIIDLAEGTEENTLAILLADRIRQNVAHSARKMQDFRALRGSVLVVAQDTTQTLTMRFDHGRLTIHDGTVGIPSVTLCGDEAVLRRLANVSLSRWLRLPKVFTRSPEGGATLWDVARAMTYEKLTMYGLLSHPRLLLFLLRVLSEEGPGRSWPGFRWVGRPDRKEPL
ncbi:hypothetical protein [Polyangium mundeleinium]|uniref:SCP2 domain-containing protein n=1 Tax=Polyangium mundeleinium TaxID=2995306 RepID=A0ABT5EFT0_9BACT|nr:hypothetical protein [Polyangium mundeleinium]MDC0739737.1 hypothetical protein [Polyangium mundeleinium]